MIFFQRLTEETQSDRQSLLNTPIIQAALNASVTRASYLAYLQEAYHHVKHTVPLLRAARDALPSHHLYLTDALNEYIEEETGHELWILDDIVASGGKRDSVQRSGPLPATELMIAYAYDTIARVNPLGFFGMVHVLEGTSVSLALVAADAIQSTLKLPNSAFSYLRSHGTLDLEHTDHFESLMGYIKDPEDQAAIIHAVKMFYRLYGDVFRSLPLPHTQASLELACH